MALLFDAASTQYLQSTSTPAITGYPFSVGLWAYPFTTGAAQVLWCLTDTSVSNHRFSLTKGSTSWGFFAIAGGSTDASCNAGTPVANVWQYIVCRAISATNRRISIIDGDTGIKHGSSVQSRVVNACDTIGIGAALSSGAPGSIYDGILGEVWYTNTDIGSDGASNLTNDFVSKLAYEGPFSIPSVAAHVKEYRSFRSDIEMAKINETKFGYEGQGYTNNNGTILGPHVPVSYRFEKPAERKRFLMI